MRSKKEPVHTEEWLARRHAKPAMRRELAVQKASLEFSEQILFVLESKGWTKAMLAELLGQSRASISQALDGTSNLTLRRMVELADACGFELHVLLQSHRTARKTVFVKPLEDDDGAGGPGFAKDSPAGVVKL